MHSDFFVCHQMKKERLKDERVCENQRSDRTNF